MGIFGQDVNINVNRDVNNGKDKDDRAKAPVITRAAVRQQRKLEQEAHNRELDRQYRELAYAEYDINDPKQIVHTMTQLAALVNSCRQEVPVAFAKPYQEAALSNLKTGIDLLRSIDATNPMIAHFEQTIAAWEKQDRDRRSFRILYIITICIIFFLSMLLLYFTK